VSAMNKMDVVDLKSATKAASKAASVRARLHNLAKAQGVDLQRLLTRYALERLLYRLSVSAHKEHFLLKGAMLFELWFDVPLRATRDMDLLGFGLAETSLLVAMFEDVCAIAVDDGMVFNAASIQADETRKEANYAGIRLRLTSTLAGAQCAIQIDVGYGDAVTPAPEFAVYPVMLSEMPAARVRVYPRYTVIAEKLEAIVSLGMANSRMKDYFDLWVILQSTPLDSQTLSQAIHATLQRRGTVKPHGWPVGLTDAFATDKQKQKQWQAFIDRNQLQAPSLAVVVNTLRDYFGFVFLGGGEQAC
jgi:predicted nucleotidyltransferase component of viral defense system